MRFALALLLIGCIHSTPIEQPPKEFPIPPRQEDVEGSANIAMTVGLPPQLWEFVANNLGDNAITLEKPLKVEHDGITLDIKGGTKTTFRVKQDEADVVFSQPFPTVSKWSLWSRLHGVTLKPDGQGVASTGLGEWRFRWLDDGTTAAPETKPKPLVLAWGMANCQPCKKAKEQLVGDDLPFDVRWDDGKPPEWSESFGRPWFWWHSVGDDPRKEKTSGEKLEGWTTKAEFVARWKKSRQSSYRQHTSTTTDILPHSRERYVSHLLNDGIHRGKFTREQLQSLTDEELLALHSDDHAGTISWAELNARTSEGAK